MGNNIVNIVIDSIESTGKALGRLDGKPVFIDRAIPGQTVEVELYKNKKTYAEGKVLKVIQKSSDEIDGRCPWFGTCGGCLWQNLPYEKQLEYKGKMIQDIFISIGKLNMDFVGTGLKPVCTGGPEWYYRNKIELSFGENDLGQTDLGFRKRRSFIGVLPIDQCHIFSEKFPEVISALRSWLFQTGKTFFDLKKFPEGFFQYLVLRRSEASGAWMFHFITRSGEFPQRDLLIQLLKEVFHDQDFSLFHTQNFGDVGYAHHEKRETKLLHGSEFLVEKLGNLEFHISPFSFFQTNTKGAEVLYSVVQELLDIKDGMKILDLFCGTGTIGQFVSAGKKVDLLGIEIVPEAVSDARLSSERNKVPAEYFCGDVRKVLLEHTDRFRDLDAVIIDPPRSGLAPKALQRSLDIGAPTLIYVSCNPSTFARDMLFIHENSDYRIDVIQPVDMFPHTGHVEIVGRFRLSPK